MNWKIEDLKKGDKFQLTMTKDIVIYQGNVGDVMFFIDSDGRGFFYGIEEVKRGWILVSPPKRGWKDLTPKEVEILAINEKKVWCGNSLNRNHKMLVKGFIFLASHAYYSDASFFVHASMYNDQGEPADNYEGLDL